MKSHQLSPLAQLFASVIARDETERAIDFARLQASSSRAQMRRDALKHAQDCIYSCTSQGIDFDEETLSANVESSFPELSIEECDEIATSALRAPRSIG